MPSSNLDLDSSHEYYQKKWDDIDPQSIFSIIPINLTKPEILKLTFINDKESIVKEAVIKKEQKNNISKMTFMLKGLEIILNFDDTNKKMNLTFTYKYKDTKVQELIETLELVIFLADAQNMGIEGLVNANLNLVSFNKESNFYKRAERDLLFMNKFKFIKKGFEQFTIPEQNISDEIRMKFLQIISFQETGVLFQSYLNEILIMSEEEIKNAYAEIDESGSAFIWANFKTTIEFWDVEIQFDLITCFESSQIDKIDENQVYISPAKNQNSFTINPENFEFEEDIEPQLRNMVEMIKKSPSFKEAEAKI
jgi:hypothetical protein